MGSNTLQQNLYRGLFSRNNTFLLVGFYVPVNFVQMESATFIALETQMLLQRLFLFLTPPISKYVSFFFLPLIPCLLYKLSHHNGVQIHCAVKTCSYRTRRNTATAP